jgi:hypothetical protein
MVRKLTGIFILLCFLLIKNSPFYIFDTFKQPVVFAALNTVGDLDQESKEVPEENKGSKQLEYADEDFIHLQVLNFTPVLPLASQLNVHFSKQTSAAYLSLPYPPPDGNA